MATSEYDKAVMQELRDHIEYRKRKPLIWLTKREVSEILVANGHWKIDSKEVMRSTCVLCEVLGFDASVLCRDERSIPVVREPNCLCGFTETGEEFLR